MNTIIRLEEEKDYRAVENLHREAFWNLSAPGCDEHLLAHKLRSHPEFIPELDYVCEVNGEVVGNVMYTHSRLTDEDRTVTPILTFGPIGVLPAYQRKGIGKAMLEKSFETAIALGYPAVVIFGNPDNYVGRGFKSCAKYNVRIGDGFPAALLVKELREGFFDGRIYSYESSADIELDAQEVARFDQSFPPKQRAWQPSQEEFFIHSHSVIRMD